MNISQIDYTLLHKCACFIGRYYVASTSPILRFTWGPIVTGQINNHGTITVSWTRIFCTTDKHIALNKATWTIYLFFVWVFLKVKVDSFISSCHIRKQLHGAKRCDNNSYLLTFVVYTMTTSMDCIYCSNNNHHHCISPTF